MKKLILIMVAIINIAIANESELWQVKSVSLLKVGLLDFNDNGIQLQNLRFQADVIKVGSPVSFFYQIETAKMTKPHANWFRLLWINYKYSGWQVRAGRIFQAAPYYTTPTPGALRFAKFPRDPWTYYAYGIQTEKSWEDGWSLIADVTGHAGLSFSDKGNFDRTQASARVAKKIGNNLMGVAFMLRPGNTLVHVEERMSDGPNSLSCVVYTALEKKEDVRGLFLNLEREVVKDLFIHARSDLRYSSRMGNSGSINTVGIMKDAFGKKLRLILDYERHNGKKTDSVYAMTQVRI